MTLTGATTDGAAWGGAGDGAARRDDVDEVWLEEAIARYRRIGQLRARLDRAAHEIEVTVRSPDELVEVRATAAGAIVDVCLAAGACARPVAELAASIKVAVVSAIDGAQWARRKIERDLFVDYETLTPHPTASRDPR